jgi:hypothetical protein
MVLATLVIVWWAFFRGVRIIFPEDIGNTDWLSRELDSIIIGRDHDGRYWVFAVGTLEARQWRKKAARAFDIPESTIELHGRW